MTLLKQINGWVIQNWHADIGTLPIVAYGERNKNLERMQCPPARYLFLIGGRTARNEHLNMCLRIATLGMPHAHAHDYRFAFGKLLRLRKASRVSARAPCRTTRIRRWSRPTATGIARAWRTATTSSRRTRMGSSASSWKGCSMPDAAAVCSAAAVSAPEASGSDAEDGARRTRAKLLAAVVAKVDAMVLAEVRGPASLLVSRLALVGVAVTEATLRSGDCRAQLERVWDRRQVSIRTFGPTGGHDMRPVGELVEHVIDLENRLGRVRADTAGQAYDRAAGNGRDPRSVAACRRHDGDVARRAALIATLIPKMAAQGVFADFETVAAAMKEAGEPLTSRTIRRNEAYWRVIWAAQGDEPPERLRDPRRAALRRKRSEEVGAMVYRLLRKLAEADAAFLAGLELAEAA